MSKLGKKKYAEYLTVNILMYSSATLSIDRVIPALEIQAGILLT